MSNSSLTLSYLILGAYVNVGHLKYFYFVITLMLFSAVIIANASLIAVICTNRSLHEPMYMFLCSLFVNELYGSIGLFPFLMIQILSDIHTISTAFCFLQIFTLYSYANVEILTLAVMSYDRYLAICHPLQYNTRMTPKKVVCIVVLIWIYTVIRCYINIALSIRLTLCGNVIDTLLCSNFAVVKLACSDTTANNIHGIFGTFFSVILPMCPILFSYGKILCICCSSGSKPMRQKAVNTCTPQLVSLLNFCFGCLFEIVKSRVNVSRLPSIFRIILSLYFVILQPLLNPFMFGLQMSKLRRTYAQVCCCRMYRKTVQVEYKSSTKAFTIYLIGRAD